VQINSIACQAHYWRRQPAWYVSIFDIEVVPEERYSLPDIMTGGSDFAISAVLGNANINITRMQVYTLMACSSDGRHERI